ncbi:MAG TPA: prenyltransferase/squalene oxidase repeat-containing protein [Vicinamibacterales bacterium]
MTMPVTIRPELALDALVDRLLERRTARDHWDGYLASSALSTATAVLALDISARHGYRDANRLAPFVVAGTAWLVWHQNADGGWGDTVRSKSNMSTTAIAWATLSALEERDSAAAHALERSSAWLRRAAGDLTPRALRSAILRRYGSDKTFSVPILTVLALTGKLGTNAHESWRAIPQLPFELAALPHGWFQHLRLPVVSYALPALIAIGQVRHYWAPSRNPMTRLLRDRVRRTTHELLRAMQPDSGGYLEATPLTSFVVMSVAGMRWTDSPVVEAGIRFLTDSIREDGSWPIDTNLATWVTTLSAHALAETEALPPEDAAAIRQWLLAQQRRREHPFTHAAPGGWAWTPLSGGVPDADDTSGALVALRHLGEPDPDACAAAAAGVRWLLGVQNRDGGVPTFCRGWGTLPFDRSTPEITAHALQAWSAWLAHLDSNLQRDVQKAARRAVRFLTGSQRREGTWIPLWFGNEHAPDENNPTYGTARVLIGLQSSLAREDARARGTRRRGVTFLLQAQNADGGWGGARGVRSSIEETGVALAALARSRVDGDAQEMSSAIARGTEWLTAAITGDVAASPMGLYFARLWYYEELYPIVFALAGLAAVRRSRTTETRLMPRSS